MRGQGGRSLRRALSAALAFAALTALAAPSAQAGTYEVWSCREPDGTPARTDGWAFSTRGLDPGRATLSDDCAAGGALRVAIGRGAPVDGGARASALLAAPAGTQIVGYTLWRAISASMADIPSTYAYAAAVRDRTASDDLDFGCASVIAIPTYNCTDWGSDDLEDPLTSYVKPSVGPIDAIELWAGCLASSCAGETSGSVPAEVRLLRARVELEDSLAPAAPELSGPLAGDRPVAGDATLVVESADDGGGIAAVTLAVDGGEPTTIAPAGPRGTCRLPYEALRPCPAAAARAFTVDTDALAEGSHAASGTVVDAAGNETAFGPVAFVVDRPEPPGPGGRDPQQPDGRDPQQPGGGNPTPPGGGVSEPPPAAVGNGLPAVRRPVLRLDRARVEATRRGARLSGALRTAEGAPIAGATLTLSTQPLGLADGRPKRLAPVTTGADGRFSALVRPDGVIRVEVAFAPAAEAADTATATATVSEPTALRIERSRARLRRGQSVVLRGEIDGAGSAARGALVEVQAVVGGRWRAVGTVGADARGRWRWRYRFVRVTRDTIFSFRAVVHRTPGWPLPEQRSRRVTVRVDAP